MEKAIKGRHRRYESLNPQPLEQDHPLPVSHNETNTALKSLSNRYKLTLKLTRKTSEMDLTPHAEPLVKYS